VVSVLATGPKDRGFKPGRGDEYLRAINSAACRWNGLVMKHSENVKHCLKALGYSAGNVRQCTTFGGSI
jgi:hypothetical protein